MELGGKHVLILGLGESGLACACWCDQQGAKVRVLDTRKAPPYLDELNRRTASADFTNGPMDESFDKKLLIGVDALVLSPGLSGGLMAVIHARAAGIPVIGEIELFAAALRDRTLYATQPPVLAITGTNGKTTTTALTGHLLQSTGKTVGVAGNISPAALAALMDFQKSGQLPDVWVLELSSFQLETTESLNPQAATVLNVSDDHLDRYIDVAEYTSVKARIFDAPNVAEGGVQVLNRNDRRVRRMARAGRAGDHLRARRTDYPRRLRSARQSRRAVGSTGASASCCPWRSFPSPACTMPRTPWRRWPCVTRWGLTPMPCCRPCAPSGACRTGLSMCVRWTGSTGTTIPKAPMWVPPWPPCKGWGARS
jgi:UDP-N-acetylmuramoylalanine-D-glutamate ligase